MGSEVEAGSEPRALCDYIDTGPALSDPERLAELQRVRLLDTPPE